MKEEDEKNWNYTVTIHTVPDTEHTDETEIGEKVSLSKFA
jgi:hypothetical protein